MMINKHILRDMAYSGDGVWDVEMVEKAIEKSGKGTGDGGTSKSSINQRRMNAKYNELKSEVFKTEKLLQN